MKIRTRISMVHLCQKRFFNMEIGTARCCLDKQVWCFSRNLSSLDWENVQKFQYHVVTCNLKTSYSRLAAHSPEVVCANRRLNRQLWRAYSIPVSVEESSLLQSEDHAINEEDDHEKSTEKMLSQALSSDELRSLLADSERQRLMIKLSEANQQNRFLKRQLHIKEDALVNFKSELAVMELEIQALVKLAEEIAQSSIPEGSRKINGKFIQSHLLSRLEAVQGKIKAQIKDVGTAQSKEVPLFWCGMAESVQVMGTFDGWCQGEHLSPEYTGSFAKFSTTLMLRPGRYEIKFLIDGEWQLSPDFPTVGEGLTKNNLLIVQ